MLQVQDTREVDLSPPRFPSAETLQQTCPVQQHISVTKEKYKLSSSTIMYSTLCLAFLQGVVLKL